jgi:hypothetical protein
MRILLTIVALSVWSLGAQPVLGGEEDEPFFGIQREVEDDPPAAHRPADDPAARTPATNVVFGPYVSIQVNVDANGQNIVGDAANEPSIAVNPTNPNNMIIGWRQFDSITSNFRQGGWGYTFNHGQNWTFPGVLTPGTFRSDPVLDFDSDGNAYYQSLLSSFDLDGFKSTNGGISWSAPVPEFGGDKNWMVIDRTGGIGDGNVYGTWQAAAGCCGNSIFTRSIDGGTSFQSPVPVAQSPGLGTLAVAPDGTVYSAGIQESFGQDLNTYVLAKSTNAKNPAVTPTFTGAVINMGGGMGFGLAPNPAGLTGQPTVAVDRTNGPTLGYVYILGSVDPLNSLSTDPIDVHFIRSTNGGSTFTQPLRVNDDPKVGNWHWLAAMSVAPNGRIDAVWNDTRNSGGQTNLSQLFYAYSWDQGQHWSTNVAASPQWDSWLGWPQQNKIGDYTTMVSDITGTDVAYAATFNREQDVYYVRLFPDCNNNGVSDVTDINTVHSSDCNTNHIPDECDPAPSCLASGRVPDHKTPLKTPLLLAKAASGQITLTWDKSCSVTDSNYGIYAGSVGTFMSHVPVVCSTAGLKTATFTPAAGDLYYLVVPNNGNREGSYGFTSANAERPVSTAACFVQQIGPCF